MSTVSKDSGSSSKKGKEVGKATQEQTPQESPTQAMSIDSDGDDDFEVSKEQYESILREIKRLQREEDRKAKLIQELQDSNTAMRGAANIITTPVQKTDGLKFNTPAPYDGTHGGLKGYLAQVRAYHSFHMGSFQNDLQRIVHAASFLKGRALAWFEPYLSEASEHGWMLSQCKTETQKIFGTYAGYEEALKSLFQDPDEKRQAERELENLKQKASASVYTAEFKRITARMDCTDDTRIMLYYQGLKEEVKDEISRILYLPTDFTQYAELVVRIDNQLYARRSEKKQTPRYHNRTTANMGRPRQNGYNNRNRDWKNKTSYGQHSGPMDLDATQRKDKSKVRCYNCEKMGHYANECRQPKKLGFKPVPEGKKQIYSTKREEVPHDSLSWTACYDDECQTHKSSKRDSGWYPKKPRTLAAAIRLGRSVHIGSEGQLVDSDSDTIDSASENEGYHQVKGAEQQLHQQQTTPSVDDTSSDEEDTYEPMDTDYKGRRELITKLETSTKEELEREFRQTRRVDTDAQFILSAVEMYGTGQRLAEILQKTTETPWEQRTPGAKYGDDPRLSIKHPQHYQVAWVGCIDPGCDEHLENKTTQGVFPLRMGKDAICYPYLAEHAGKAEVSYCDARGYVVLASHPTPPQCSIDEKKPWWTCPQDDCTRHMPNKAEAWKRIRDLRISGKLKIKPVEETFDVRNVMNTTRREPPLSLRHTVTMISKETNERIKKTFALPEQSTNEEPSQKEFSNKLAQIEARYQENGQEKPPSWELRIEALNELARELRSQRKTPETQDEDTGDAHYRQKRNETREQRDQRILTSAENRRANRRINQDSGNDLDHF